MIEIREGKHGQVAVFLTIVLVILLIAALALVNIGKIGTRRVRTANAADSAALATASSLAGIANYISRYNQDVLIPAYIAFQLMLLLKAAALFSCMRTKCSSDFCPTYTVDYLAFMAYAMETLMQYLALMYNSQQGFDAARVGGHRMIFGNVGIEEAPRRDSYTREILKPHLAEWLDNNRFEDSLSYTYNWRAFTTDLTTGESVMEQEDNEVTSYVDPGDCVFVLDPMPAMITPSPLYKFKYSVVDGLTFPYVGCVQCLCPWCYIVDKIAWWGWFAQIYAQDAVYAEIMFTLAVLGKILSPMVGECPAQFTLGDTIAAVLAACICPIIAIPALPPIWMCQGCVCSMPEAQTPAIMVVTFIVPVPWINDIANDDLTITTRATYTEPTQDMGFWRRKRTRTTSSATARIWGDFWDPGSYQAELTGTD